MSHSGCNGGVKSRFRYSEAKCTEIVLIDTQDLVKKKYPIEKTKNNGFVRPKKAYCVLIDELVDKNVIDIDELWIYPFKKAFSVKGLGAGLRKIGEVFNQPMWGKKNDV